MQTLYLLSEFILSSKDLGDATPDSLGFMKVQDRKGVLALSAEVG
jgi:hypothetical protein